MQTVYADVLFLLNFSVDFILLYACGRFFSAETTLLRLSAGAALGGLFSYIIFFPKLPDALVFASNIVFAALLILCVYGVGKTARIKRFIKLYLAFLGISCTLAGVTFALYLSFSPNGMIISNGVMYMNISPLLLLGVTAFVYICYALIRKLKGFLGVQKKRIRLDICFMNEQISLTALVDTGHSLHDAFEEIPVIIASKHVVSRIIPKDASDFFSNGCEASSIPDGRYRLVPYSSLGHDGILPAFIPELVLISDEDGVLSLEKCLVAVCNDRFGDGVDALIPPDLFETATRQVFSFKSETVNHRKAAVKK